MSNNNNIVSPINNKQNYQPNSNALSPNNMDPLITSFQGMMTPNRNLYDPQHNVWLDNQQNNGGNPNMYDEQQQQSPYNNLMYQNTQTPPPVIQQQMQQKQQQPPPNQQQPAGSYQQYQQMQMQQIHLHQLQLQQQHQHQHQQQQPPTYAQSANPNNGGQRQLYNHYPSFSQTNARNKTGRRYLNSFFMSETLRQDLLKQKSLLYTNLDPSDPRMKNIPPLLHKYHSLYPLDSETSRDKVGMMFGYPTSVYKAISTNDGFPYAIRRVEGFRLSSEFALQAADTWRNIQHPSIVSLKEIFVSKEFGDNNSIFFSYEFHPGSETLESKYLTQSGIGLNESVLWSFVCQLVSALKMIHSNGLVCRVIHPSKILLTGKNRIRINGVGIFDVVNFDTPRNLAQFQHEDLVIFGRLLLSLACRSAVASTNNNLNKSIEHISTQYSKEFKNLIITLLSKPALNMAPPTIDDIISMIGPRLLQENVYLHSYTDELETELTKEVENGRLFRMLVKLGFINERPSFDVDPRWSETGDRYLLKLFRDYVFHQVYDDGTPVLDFYHVIDSINKLDGGVNEKILLMSRDEQSLLVVSYKDLKRCIDGAFSELVNQKPHQ